MILGLAIYDLATKSIRFVVEVKTSPRGDVFIRLDHTTPRTYCFPDAWRGEYEWLDAHIPLAERLKYETDFDLIWGTMTEHP